jgi:hypothetical protein
MDFEGYSRQVPWDRSLRCSDRDREAVADILRRAHVAGRLDADEFAERFGRALQARTYADLDALVADLPAEQDLAPRGRCGYETTGWGASGWPVPDCEGPAQPTTGGYGSGPFGFPSRIQRLWPVGTFLLIWLAIAFAVFVLTGGHVFWLFLPLAWVFWARRGGRCWQRRRRSPHPPPSQTWL